MKIKYIIPFIVAVLIFSFSLNSCMLISLLNEESKEKIVEEPEMTEDDSKSTQNKPDKETEEENEVLENLEESKEKED